MKIRKNCRICNYKLKKIIFLKKIFLVGHFYKYKKNLKKFPITLCFCKKCKHVQIAEIINPTVLFEKYMWETNVSKTNHYLFLNLLKNIKKKINNKHKILEIASNDGSFLNFIKKKYKNSKLVGIDPAKNLAIKNKEIKIIKSFFNHKESKKIKILFGKFDFIFARNVVAHVSNPNEIFKGIFELLANGGIAIIEVPHLLPIIKNNQYDNIFHEHQGFHTLKSIKDLCDKNNLKLIDAKIIDSQGGSLRCQIMKENNLKINKNVSQIIKNEIRNKLFNEIYLKSYKLQINNHKKNLIRLINSLLNKKKIIYAYGASGKGQALIQYCDIDNSKLVGIFDKSKLKSNKYIPGVNIKIFEPNKIEKKKIDYILLLSWNLKNEILKQEKKFLEKGGKFIIPFPKPRII